MLNGWRCWIDFAAGSRKKSCQTNSGFLFPLLLNFLHNIFCTPSKMGANFFHLDDDENFSSFLLHQKKAFVPASCSPIVIMIFPVPLFLQYQFLPFLIEKYNIPSHSDARISIPARLRAFWTASFENPRPDVGYHRNLKNPSGSSFPLHQFDEQVILKW